LKTQDNCDAVK